MAMKQLVVVLVGATALFVLLIPSVQAITIESAAITSGSVAVSGSQAAKSANITWEGGFVTKSTKGGAFTFTTTTLPSDCVGTLSDGVTTLNVVVSGCTAVPATGKTSTSSQSFEVDTLTARGVTVPDDGTVRAGAPLRYNDNGDGTITDLNTGLMWEKKSAEGGLHDVGNVYPWSSFGTTTIWDWLALVNAEGGTGFAGHNDWRIPNVKELVNIVDFERVEPAVDPAFDNGVVSGCTVLTCSATGQQGGPAPWQWSSTNLGGGFPAIWAVDFAFGAMHAEGFGSAFYIRAVRGGL